MVYGDGKDWLTNWAEGKDAPIWRITIPKKSVPAVKIQLRDAGVTESVIFPDLDCLGRELDQFWDSLRRLAKFKK
jgi:hypothetical protein